MASSKQVLLLLLSLLTLSSVIIKPSHAVDCPKNMPGGKIAVYWGQNKESEEGSLTDACDDSNHYDIVAIAYLHVSGSETSLNLVDHCPSGDCTYLESEIKQCKSKGVQVFLSVEVDSVDDPDSLAKYLYDNFLSGKSGPLGAVALDGIDLAHTDDTFEKWDELVKAIAGSTKDRKIFISGAPRCDTTSMDSAIRSGLLDYLWIGYYDRMAACEYLGENDFTGLTNSWKAWTTKPGLEQTSVFLGLVASSSPVAASSGYISPETLMSQVLPKVNVSSKFGGVMLWNRLYDKETDYSAKIKDDLSKKACECVCHNVAASSRFDSLLAKPV